MFVDFVKITVKAGNGGNGAVSFRREKYVAAGGPDGGDGGRGGSIIFKIDDNVSTLSDFRYKRKYKAENGNNGSGSHKSGKSSEDLIITVPRGTIIKEAETGTVLADMAETEMFVAAKGGTGGWGNSHFATATRQVPRFAKDGMPGEEWTLLLELKLLADVGLIGFPNVGKSTLVNRILGEERVIVFDLPGTTRDAITIPFERKGKPYTLVDTAGIRRRKNVTEIAEKFSIVKTLQAIKECNVAVVVIDGQTGLVEQDLHLLSFVLESGRALVIAVNKWDNLDQESRDQIKKDIDRRCGVT